MLEDNIIKLWGFSHIPLLVFMFIFARSRVALLNILKQHDSVMKELNLVKPSNGLSEFFGLNTDIERLLQFSRSNLYDEIPELAIGKRKVIKCYYSAVVVLFIWVGLLFAFFVSAVT